MPHVMNMDGIEWKRPKWSKLQRAWLRLNEWIGAHVADHLVADHPEIEKHLQRHTAPEKITMIPYGADRISSTEDDLIGRFGLTSKQYYLLIARPEPENSVVEVVKAFSRAKRGLPLVVLGLYSPDNPYHHRVMEAAGPEVLFLGTIYERDVVQALRSHTRAYFHGHTVGGTNPSLVESLGTGTAIIAHDNRYNRWVAGDGARYFHTADDLATLIGTLEAEPNHLIAMEAASRGQHKAFFTKETPLELYEQLLQSQVVANTIKREIPAIRPTEKDSTI
jgi:glycosyltransferase involved in cell wall biosynthesis